MISIIRYIKEHPLSIYLLFLVIAIVGAYFEEVENSEKRKAMRDKCGYVFHLNRSIDKLYYENRELYDYVQQNLQECIYYYDEMSDRAG